MTSPPAPSAEAMRFWCEIMRDDNAIHLDPAAAEAAGFGPNRVNPGPANLALLMDAILAAEPGAAFSRIEARFLGNVFEADTLEVRTGPDGAALYRADAPDEPVLEAKFTMRRNEQ